MSKEIKVISLFVNKEISCDQYLENLECLEKYFTNDLQKLTSILAHKFDLPCKGWNEIVAEISIQIENDSSYRTCFTLGAVLLDMQEKRNSPGALEEQAKEQVMCR